MKKYATLLSILLITVGCARHKEASLCETTDQDGPEICGFETAENNLIPALINVKVSEEFASELEKATAEDGYVTLSQTRAAASGAIKMRRMFPDAGKFEKRTREAGLHLWYEVQYEPDCAATKAASDFSRLPGIVLIESNPKIGIIGGREVYGYEDCTKSDIERNAESATFNDPKLDKQWHYYNNGSASSSSSGCDINVVPVWKNYTTGDKDVIVAVVDGGIDFKHEDLADNMWQNPNKKGDEQYGFNFAKNNYKVTADEHGTHVAGTISAVNNNGKGVCGIAGGNAAKKIKGVKLMSCQIFDGNSGGSGATAIKWAADNGAVISQNSWGYTSPTSMPASLKESIEYFIKNAGYDENGKQDGPIAGGLVFFSAGNANSSQIYGTVGGGAINVSSVGADYYKAYYSNYGTWVDIAAPGGDVKKGNQILSTLPDNKYGYMQGTSMACPHVSGVAALLVSKMKGNGVTQASVRKKLLENVTDISSFNKLYNMGSGLVNAYAAMAGSGGKKPGVPKNLKASSNFDNVNISVTVPRDEDDGVPTSIVIYYSQTDFTSVKNLPYSMFYVQDKKAGDTLEGTIPGMGFNTKYYLCAVARDLAGNNSDMSEKVTVTTGDNYPPEIISLDGEELKIKAYEEGKLRFEINNPAKHYFRYSLQREDSLAVNLDTTDYEKPVFVVNGPITKKENEGIEQTVTLSVADNYGGMDKKTIKYTILKNNPPSIGKRFEDVIFNSRNDEPVKLKASDYFKDEDGEELSYKINIDGGSANFVYSKGYFILTPMEYGYSDISVTGFDVRAESASQSFRVLVRNSQNDVDIYPNPVKDNLYVRTSTDAIFSIKIYTSIGGLFFEAKDLDVTPFEPAVIDMSGATPGMYYVKLEINDKEYKYNIVKM